jgi:hypothetical protein
VALSAITIGALAFLVVVLYVPAGRSLFQFSTLHVDDIAVCILLAMASVTWFEVAKLWRRSRFPKMTAES